LRELLRSLDGAYELLPARERTDQWRIEDSVAGHEAAVAVIGTATMRWQQQRCGLGMTPVSLSGLGTGLKIETASAERGGGSTGGSTGFMAHGGAVHLKCCRLDWRRGLGGGVVLIDGGVMFGLCDDY
jgi:hypothetical protein